MSKNASSSGEDFQSGLHADFIVIWKSFTCSLVGISYLCKRWFPSGSMGRATGPVLVRSCGSGRPLVNVTQRCKVTTVLNTGTPLKFLTHTVTVKNITLTGFTLGDRERMRKEDLWKNIKPGFLIWQGIQSSPTVRLSSKSICQWTKSEQIYSILFSLATVNDSHVSWSISDSLHCQQIVNYTEKWTLTSINY